MNKRIYTKGDKKILRAWAFYDWANSVYPLVIGTAVFPIFYGELFVESDYIDFLGINYKNTALIQHITSLVFLLLAFLIPILSGIADFLGNKKNFMKFFCYLGSASCVGLYFFDLENIYIGLSFYFLALFSFWASLVFYNSYLPDIAFPKQQDRISALGFSYGYVGSVLLLVFNLIMIMFPEFFGLSNSNGEGSIQAMRISFLLVGLWWAGFSQYTFLYLPQNLNDVNKKDVLKNSVIFSGFLELKEVWKILIKDISVKKFLIAFFTFSCALQTIILIATYFGEQEILWGENEKFLGLILSMLIIQLIAIFGAWLTARVSEKIGNIRTLIILNLIWFILCLVAYFVKYPIEFYIIAGFVGMVMGGTQALSRSTYSKLIPDTENTCSYFSFYQMSMIVSVVLGTFMSGVVDQLTGSIRNSIMIFAIVFILGALLLRGIKMKNI
ncbi:MAG: MFS transporter [Bacteroidota bacterium]|nr:MFS transporter [Bacteroidota bacterium]